MNAASSTLLANTNTWSATQLFAAVTLTNGTSTNFSITSLTSALPLAAADGSLSEYAGTSCTNQFVRSLNGAGVAACTSVQDEDLNLADITLADFTNDADFVKWAAATSTLWRSAGLLSTASSTIGNGSQSGGLTISGGATTTGFLVVQGTAASSTFAGSVDIAGALKVGTGSIFLNGSATSTYSAGVEAAYLNITGASATSTFARGINLAAGCFSVSGTCVGGGGGAGGSDTQVQFNDGGAIGGDAGFTYNKTTDTLSVGALLPVASASASTSRHVTIDSVGVVGGDSDVIVPADGKPFIAYQDQTDTRLIAFKCGNSNCTSGNASTSISIGGNPTYINVATSSDGTPVIAAQETTGDDLEVVKCGNADCSSGNTITTVDSGGNIGTSLSMTIPADNLPIMAYYDGTNQDLKIAKCGNAACSSGNTLTTVDSANNVGLYTSIAIGADGLPVVAYKSSTDDVIKVLKCGNATCSSGNTITTIVSAGTFTSLIGTKVAVGTDGYPIVAVMRGLNTQYGVQLIKCGNADCSSGNTSTLVPFGQAGDTAQGYFDLTTDSAGLPIVVVSVNSNYPAHIKIARCSTAACSSIIEEAVNVSTGVTSVSVATSTAGLTVGYSNANNDMVVYTEFTTSGGGSLGSSTLFFNSLYAGAAYLKNSTVSAFDLAENYSSHDALLPGEIVAVATGTPGYVKRAESGDVLLGVVSTKPGITLADWADSGGYPIALAGRVPVKVSAEGGAISIGDRIALSTVAGIGKRAEQGENTLGYALSAFDGEGEGVVEMFVDLRSNPATETATSTQLTAEGGLLAGVSQSLKDGLTYALDALRGFATRIGDAVYATVGVFKTLFADRVHTDELCLGNTCIGEFQFKALIERAGQAANAALANASSTPTAPEEQESANTTEPLAEPSGESTAGATEGESIENPTDATDDDPEQSPADSQETGDTATSTPMVIESPSIVPEEPAAGPAEEEQEQEQEVEEQEAEVRPRASADSESEQPEEQRNQDSQEAEEEPDLSEPVPVQEEAAPTP